MVEPHLSMPCPSEYLWSHVLNSATECVCHLTDIFTFSSFSNQSKVHFCNGILLNPDSYHDFDHHYRLFVNGLFTKAKIGELHMASCIKENVLWLQVTVNDPLERHHRKHIQLFIHSFWGEDVGIQRTCLWRCSSARVISAT